MSDVTAPGRKQRVAARVEAARARVESARSTVTGVDAAFVAFGRDRRVGGNLLACAVAYRLFVWFLPLALMLAALLGFLYEARARSPADAANDLGMGAYVVRTVNDAAQQANSSRWLLLVIALYGLYVASSGGAKAVLAVHSLAWGLPPQRPRRSWVTALGFTGFAFAAVALATFENWLQTESGRLGLGFRLLMIVVLVAYWLGASLLLPHAEGPWTMLLPGALLFAVGTQLIHLVTVFYLADRVTNASELYGALGAAAAILLWLYLIGRLVVGAAVLNATLWERSR